MRKSIIFYLLIILSFSLSSCGARYKKGTITGTVVKESYNEISVKSNFVIPEIPIDYKIISSHITESILTINLTYSGGCEEHTFELMFNGMYMKSLPRQGSLYLLHNSNGDMCKKLIEKELKYNLAPIVGTSKQDVNYELYSYPEKLKYRKEINLTH